MRKLSRLKTHLAALTIALLAGSYLVLAQAPAGGQGRGPGGPPQPMSFFITSASKGDGANYGGVAGADAYCQQLATAAGRGTPVTWHAYLSTQGAGAINARDRIGNGPWFNSRGQRIGQSVAELHGDTIDQARMGNALGKQFSLTEKQGIVNGVGDMPNQHDILTGSQPDGRAYTDSMDHTCNNWTSNNMGTAQLGHADKQGGGNGSWNSTHASRGCSQENLISTGGAGFLYCFAVN
jgi:hypothetical protein